jgi:hypothetical protein
MEAGKLDFEVGTSQIDGKFTIFFRVGRESEAQPPPVFRLKFVDEPSYKIPHGKLQPQHIICVISRGFGEKSTRDANRLS